MRGLAEIIPLRSGDCRDAAAVIPEIAAGEATPDSPSTDHVAQCLRCQAEVAAYRRILRHLHALRGEGVAPAPGHLAAVLAALEAAQVESATWVVRAAYLGGITAAAGAAGVLVWMSRRRLADAV